MLSLDIVSFFLLVEASDRKAAGEKFEDAWIAMAAAQGSVDAMKDMTDPWKQLMTPVQAEPENDFAKLKGDLQKFSN